MRRRSHGSLIVLYTGLAILAVGAVLIVSGMYGVSAGLEDGVSRGPSRHRLDLEVPDDPGASSSIDLNHPGLRYAIYFRFDEPLESESAYSSADVEVTVTGPGGEPVAVDATGLITDRSLFTHHVGSFDASESGTHQLHVTRTESLAEGDARVEAIELRQVGSGEGRGKLLAGGIAVALGVLAAIVGVLLVVIGGIWWLVSSSRR